MSNVVISLFFAIGASAWIFTKLQRQTGNNNRSALIATAISAAILFVLLLLILNRLF